MAKRLTLVFVAALALSMLFVGVAFANFGPHGGYVQDTDACAACHRAHTSFATATFTDNQGGQRYGLLVSGASSITEFCLACHGDSTPGASTNVQSGIFDAGPSASSTNTVTNVYTPYATDSTYLGALNGGAFTKTVTVAANGTISTKAYTTSTHQMESSNLPMWGSFGTLDSPKTWGLFTCTDCHDPHGSSNYRILRDQVNGGVAVGGYIGSTPNPWVVSNEAGYPAGGWDKGDQGAAEVDSYRPSYTAEKFANSGVDKSMSNWCAGCHTQYATRNDTVSTTGHTKVDNGAYEADPYNTSGADYNAAPTGATGSGAFVDPAAPNDGSSTFYNAVGDQARHRHPVNISMTAAFSSSTPFYSTPLLSAGLPLEMPQGTNLSTTLSTDSSGTPIYWTQDGTVGCLTCHFAHGTTSTMDGWANAELQPGSLGMVPVQLTGLQTNVPGGSVKWPGGTSTTISGEDTGTNVPMGVNPGFSSALLRYPNRGVCERCHNK